MDLKLVLSHSVNRMLGVSSKPFVPTTSHCLYCTSFIYLTYLFYLIVTMKDFNEFTQRHGRDDTSELEKTSSKLTERQTWLRDHLNGTENP